MNLSSIAEHLPAPVIYVDRELVYRYINPTGLRWHQRTKSELIGRSAEDVLPAEEFAALQPRHEQVLAGETMTFLVTRTFRDGVTRTVRTDYVPDRDASGAVVGFFILLTDLSAQVALERAAQHRANELQDIADAMPALMCQSDREHRYRFVNRTMAEWLEVDAADLPGKTPAEVFGAEAFERMRPNFERALAGETVRYSDARQYPDGRIRHIEVTLVPQHGADDEIDGYCVLAVDVSEQIRRETELRLQASTDPLTGLANRRRLLQGGKDELNRARRFGRPLSVVVADIDRFKQINDRFGHAKGDAVLRGFSEFCKAAVRGASDCAGRIGGEEFAFILPETPIEGAARLAERLRRELEGFDFGTYGAPLQVTCSFGVTQWEPADQEIEDTLKRADDALYGAKKAGRNRVVTDQSSAAFDYAASGLA